MPYPQAFKEAMVRKMTGPNAVSATALAEQVGVPQSSLSRWLREARNLDPMKKKKNQSSAAQSPREWSLEEKLRVILAAEQVAEKELGAFLRREGLHEAQLKEWREALEAALATPRSRRRKRISPDAKRVKKLEKELRRKEKALAEVTALLVLKKKLEAFWEAKERGTQRTSEE